MADDIEYGADVSTYPDLDGTGRFIDGPRAVAERVTRRLETEPELVADFVPADECMDLREELSRPHEAASLALLGRRIETIAKAEDTVDANTVEVTVRFGTEAGEEEDLFVEITGELLQSGPFRWVIGATAAAVQLLETT